jgi:outer membrane lipoprotein SlyB
MGKATAATPVAQIALAPATAPSPSVPATTDTPEPVPAATAQKPKPVAAPKKVVPAHQATPRKLPKPVEYSEDALPSHTNRGTTPVANYPVNDAGAYAENSRQQAPSTENAYTCHDCATVESVREVKQHGDGTGLGAIGGGVIGGLLGNQVGGGKGKIVGAVVGAVGGAYAGNEVEKRVRSSTQFEIAVRLDDGNNRVFTESQAPGLQRGDRVRVSNGQLSRI